MSKSLGNTIHLSDTADQLEHMFALLATRLDHDTILDRLDHWRADQVLDCKGRFDLQRRCAENPAPRLLLGHERPRRE